MAILALNHILLIAIPSLIVLILVITFLLILLLKWKWRNSSSSASSASFRKSSIDKSQISNAIAIGYSPDMRSCMYNGKLMYSAALKERKRGGGQVFTYKELELATDGFSPENVIGNGGFGVVFRGVLRDGMEAAVKVLHREGKQGEREFRMEVDLLSRLHSCYLVTLLGYCADQQHRLLVFEFLPNGSLQRHLHPAPCNHHHRSLDWWTRLRIALDCARGLEFLHEHTVPAVIHRDFKCSNILLDHNFRAKVSDFGMARTGSDKVNGQVLTRVLGTSGYVAPEYASTGRLTTKSDVYSYGVVLLELLTGRVPVDITRPPGEHALVSWVGKTYLFSLLIEVPQYPRMLPPKYIYDPALKFKNYHRSHLTYGSKFAHILTHRSSISESLVALVGTGTLISSFGCIYIPLFSCSIFFYYIDY